MNKQGFNDDINSTHVFCKFREIIYQTYMNLETILSDTYYIQIHKLTTIEYPNSNIMNWHRTLKCPAQDLSLSANRDLPSCDPSQNKPYVHGANYI
jgi:hypothetical protein